ncbi:Threonine synthase [Lacunisphaera limnophila]|uniref:Threonine synthase n=1 Tax=Lacunisphaera limnophila TaxID=1838286 RepID=A0A1D8AXS1_9BACT|nr:threonine synthase [Lacunisphaera limnophila]AOS45685.1 Threonine synthase [Lacunisphaera limnophila]
MKYVSTRGQTDPVSFREAVAIGLAPDGGLFLPETLPDISPRLPGWRNLSYTELCAEFLGLFATDVPPEVLQQLIHRSYGAFTHPEIAPLRKIDDRLYVLELFHGPTLAFKDFALQFLGNLYGWECEQTGRTINVLGATSGDTGAAAIHGLLGKPKAASFILYPEGRVSPLQERQMTCTGAANVHAIAIDGSFDDAQRVLKDIFANKTFATQHRLSAVNSINIARVLAQSVYYLHAWLRLPEAERGNVEFVVPTGNFGNVFAGWLLQQMGVPVMGYKVATNRNDILHRLFTTAEYRSGEVHPSLAPSMDIQVASNFERFLYYALDENPTRVNNVMAQIKATGAYRFDLLNRSLFSSSSASDDEITSLIRRVYERYRYIVDPHTACAFKDINPQRISIVLATAHPAKFPAAIRDAIGQEPTSPVLEVLKTRPVVKHRLPAEAEAIKAFIAQRAI